MTIFGDLIDVEHSNWTAVCINYSDKHIVI